MTQKHTPTPWHTQRGYIAGFGRGIADCAINGSNDVEYEQDKTNAAFIVRACNNYDGMLTSLEMAHSYLTIKSIDGDVEGDFLRKGIAYAICKARGEA